MLPPGWTLLESDEDDRYWSRFQSDFGFRASTSAEFWPAIAEPTPSFTFDLSSVFGRDPAGFAAGAGAVNVEVCRALTRHLPGPLIVLDWQHPGYRLEPGSAAARRSSMDDWPVTPFPDGDYVAFLSENSATGTFGHPWEQSLCVFGPALVNLVGTPLQTWLPVLRVDGRGVGAAEQLA